MFPILVQSGRQDTSAAQSGAAIRTTDTRNEMAQDPQQTATVFIVDDDPAIRFAMQALMDSVNLRHEIYGSGDEFLEQVIEPASTRLMTALRIEETAPVIKLVRLRFVEDEPIVLVTSYLPYDICPKLVQADLSERSLYAFLKAEYGLSVASGRRRIEAVAAGETEARWLQVEAGSPLLKLDSVSYLEDGTPLEYFHGVFRGDRSRFEVEIDRTLGLSNRSDIDEDDWLP